MAMNTQDRPTRVLVARCGAVMVAQTLPALGPNRLEPPALRLSSLRRPKREG